MSVELTIPSPGESIKEVVVAEWLKREGDRVELDEPVAIIETDKANLELAAPAAGVLTGLRKAAGEWAVVGETIATIEEGTGAATAAKTSPPAPDASARAAAPAARPSEPLAMPSAERLAAASGVDPASVEGTGRGGRILKEDVARAIAPSAPAPARSAAPATPPSPAAAESDDGEEVVPMSPLRRRVAQRLVEAQSNAALLTTFNEVDMSAAKALRKEYGEAFQRRHGAKLGFMSFFVKAAVEALKEVPGVNAEIRGTNIVYRNRYDIGVAVGGGKGLVVPVIRRAERLGFADVEKAIADFGARAQAGKIELAELQGGTFTISNGGVYGSLLSTPIVNPPQSGILGLHAIQDRPVAVAGQVAIRPMMYVALTYDHRIVDGREAVTFLKRIKEIVENPARMLLEV